MWNTNAAKTVSDTDKLEISSDALELYTEKQEIRTDKIEDIRSRIAAGSYMVNSTDIVDKMMQSVGLI